MRNTLESGGGLLFFRTMDHDAALELGKRLEAEAEDLIEVIGREMKGISGAGKFKRRIQAELEFIRQVSLPHPPLRLQLSYYQVLIR